MLKDVDFELHVQEPFFTQLYEGVKTVEGRCAVGDYKRYTYFTLSYFTLVILKTNLMLETSN